MYLWKTFFFNLFLQKEPILLKNKFNAKKCSYQPEMGVNMKQRVRRMENRWEHPRRVSNSIPYFTVHICSNTYIPIKQYLNNFPCVNLSTSHHNMII